MLKLLKFSEVPAECSEPVDPTALGQVLNWHSSQFKNNHFTEMCGGTEAGSYLRLIDSCITQLKAQGPARTCNESKEKKKKKKSPGRVLESRRPHGSRAGALTCVAGKPET